MREMSWTRTQRAIASQTQEAVKVRYTEGKVKSPEAKDTHKCQVDCFCPVLERESTSCGNRAMVLIEPVNSQVFQRFRDEFKNSVMAMEAWGLRITLIHSQQTEGEKCLRENRRMSSAVSLAAGSVLMISFNLNDIIIRNSPIARWDFNMGRGQNQVGKGLFISTLNTQFLQNRVSKGLLISPLNTQFLQNRVDKGLLISPLNTQFLQNRVDKGLFCMKYPLSDIHLSTQFLQNRVDKGLFCMKYPLSDIHLTSQHTVPPEPSR
ncbi:hypothetical protein STEG23_009841 [Scotinomys teguina]